MIVVLDRGATQDDVAEVLDELAALGLEGRVLRTTERSLVHVSRGSTRLARRLARMERVTGLVPTSGPRVRREGRRFYPYHFVTWCAVAFLAMGALVALAGFLPPGLGDAVDPRAPAPAGFEPWYLRGLQRAAAAFPAGSAWMVWPAALAALVLLYLMPRLERAGGARGRSAALAVGGALLAIFVYVLLP